MKLPLTGQCQCGAVRYEIRAEPLSLQACHCTDCQKQSSSAFGMSMIVPREAVVVVAGEPKTWVKPHPSGRLSDCVFCGTCGSRLWHNPHVNTKITILKAGTLDDTSWLDPVGHIWIKSKQPWVQIPQGAITYEAQPPDWSRLMQAWAERRAATAGSA